MMAMARLTPYDGDTHAREEEVFWWVCELHSEKAAAKACGLSVNTVQNYRKRLYRRLNACSRDDALQILWPFGRSASYHPIGSCYPSE
jgi:DNA-binding CsgD family transcriptional regulator